MLESLSKKEYGENEYGPTVLEQWSTYAEMAERNTEKRAGANNLHITINLALLAVVTAGQTGTMQRIVMSILGIAACIVWHQSILSYRMLSSVKYHILNEMEKYLPMAPYREEWLRLREKKKSADNKKYVQKKKDKKQYVRLTVLEDVLPYVFGGLYAITILISIVTRIILTLPQCKGG